MSAWTDSRCGKDVPACDHHWISRHQPDFPPPIRWVRVCSLCGGIDSADLARELAQPDPDPWCRDPACEWANWRSGDPPTHKLGRDCPAWAT